MRIPHYVKPSLQPNSVAKDKIDLVSQQWQYLSLQFVDQQSLAAFQ
jgi:hypothetical protein